MGRVLLSHGRGVLKSLCVVAVTGSLLFGLSVTPALADDGSVPRQFDASSVSSDLPAADNSQTDNKNGQTSSETSTDQTASGQGASDNIAAEPDTNMQDRDIPDNGDTDDKNTQDSSHTQNDSYHSTDSNVSNQSQSTAPAQSQPQIAQELDSLAAANRGTIGEGDYIIIPRVSAGLALDVAGSATGDGANVVVNHDGTAPSQRWNVTEDSQGYIVITNQRSGKVLDVYGGKSISGANVQQSSADGSRAQRWIAIRDGDAVMLRSALADGGANMLDVHGGSTKSGTNVEISSNNGTRAQQWRFEPAADVEGPILDYWNTHQWLGHATQNATETNFGLTQTFRNGVVYYIAAGHRTVGMTNQVYQKYSAYGAENGILGYPQADASNSGKGTMQRFDNGVIASSSARGTFVVTGAVERYWTRQHAGSSWLGYPMADSVTQADGAVIQPFEGGRVISDAAQAYPAAVWSRWNREGGASGWLGSAGDDIVVQYYNGMYFKQFSAGLVFSTSTTDVRKSRILVGNIYRYWLRHRSIGLPTSDQISTPRLGYGQSFPAGNVYTSPNHGTFIVSNQILMKYWSMGSDRSLLGLPTSEVKQLRAGGKSQVFEYGQIHWSPATGAHYTRGAMLQYWGARGWVSSRLGYPTTDEHSGLRDGGTAQGFQGGNVFWSPRTGAHAVYDVFMWNYYVRGNEHGKLGYPTSEAYDWGKGRAQSFQHGSLVWNVCGKLGWQNPRGYFQVSSCDVSVPQRGKFGYATPSRIHMSATRQQAIEAMISRAYEYMGTRYVWDYALRPGEGVDCAGLVMQSLYAAGMNLGEYNPANHWYDPWHSHDANNMAADSRFLHVPLTQRQRGDLIYWPGHIAIYLGNDQIIEANVPAVRTNSLWAYGWPSGALRPFI